MVDDDCFWGHLGLENTYKSLAEREELIRGWKDKRGKAGVPKMHRFVWYPKIGLVDDLDERMDKLRIKKESK